ncbi:Transposon Ty3-G Gag-Pol poly [Paramuricea clavata]|uniref:Transposon Ty3-G Gag-Pol poly n=1 Tax=Paramuricea clavata TaxID=317549 RepID=A0A6S7HES7_PARCT|nr:Transposon Ty3-G Gag-Pol poly [Paramuricea clavata]
MATDDEIGNLTASNLESEDLELAKDSSDPHDYLSSDEINNEDGLTVTDKGNLKWNGSYMGLKNFIMMQQISAEHWTSSGGDCKKCEDSGLIIRWYSSKGSLTFGGEKSKEVKNKLLLLAQNKEEVRTKSSCDKQQDNLHTVQTKPNGPLGAVFTQAAIVEDMTHYIKPTLASNPAEVIVHIGTNDLKYKSPRTLLKMVDNLGEMITESKDVKLTLSEIITRCDDETLADKLNITSLTKHTDELRILITEMNFDILCINETRIDKTIKNSEIGLQGYDLTRRDRNRRGGGVAIYIRNTIPYVERSTIIPENVEAVCIEVRKPNAKPILISTWYRPPNSNSEILDSFEIFLQNIDTENKEIIITGDFNIDLMPSETENSKAKRLKELLNTYQLSQLIKKPTRTTESTKTLLDLIICKTDDPKPATTDVVELGISDHNLVYTCRKVGICKQKPKIIETRQYHKLNNAKF